MLKLTKKQKKALRKLLKEWAPILAKDGIQVVLPPWKEEEEINSTIEELIPQ